jgi:hypothetical protein
VQHGHGPGLFHAVRFYDNEASLCRIVASFLKEGLMLGHPAVIIATPEHGQGIIAELRARDVEVKALQRSDALIVLDAVETMNQFMEHGVPNRERFLATIKPVLARARQGVSDCVIRAYGEMVDVLWKDGRDIAAIQLEMLWNQLGRTEGFSLMCGYAMGHFYKDASVRDVCRQHTHTIAADGTPRVSTADSLLVGTLRS